jgi:hypothetical protein
MYTKISTSKRLLAPRKDRNQTLTASPASRLRGRLNTKGQMRSQKEERREDEKEIAADFDEENGRTEERR